MKMTRKEFLTNGLLAVGGAVGLVAAGCGSDGDGDGGGSGDCSGGTSAEISANHGHTLSVPQADVDAGTAKTYGIQGSSAHPHDVTISQANFADLQRGMTINVVSTNDAGHDHPVTVRCG